MITTSLLNMIDKGKLGQNIGLLMGQPKMEKCIYGLQRKYMYTLFGDQGSGKSTYALFSFVYMPLKQMLGDPRLKIIYYSLEMSSEVLLAKLLSLYIWDTYKVIVTYEEILSLTGIISNEKYGLIQESVEWLHQVEKQLIIYDKRLSADGFYAHLKSFLEENGEFKDTNTTNSVYIPKVNNPYFIVVLDHIGLLNAKTTIKAEIDKMCGYAVYLRNKASLSIVLVQQANRGMKSMDRRNGGYSELQMDDMADSSSPSQASEIVIGIYHPFREKLKKCRGYNIEEMGDRFRLLQVLKNRFGVSDKVVGSGFYGEIGYWKELPKPEDINDYTLYKHLQPLTKHPSVPVSTVITNRPFVI